MSKSILVTGSTYGIGLMTTGMLAAAGQRALLHGHRPVYLVAHQGDDAKVWTSALFITFR